MKNPPASVRIAGMLYKVAQRSAAWSEEKDVDALCHPQSQLIELNRTLAGERKAMILLHEVLHACWDAADLSEDGDEEEQVVARISRALYVTLRDNPKLIEFIQNSK
jgi:hypothetical protein